MNLHTLIGTKTQNCLNDFYLINLCAKKRFGIQLIKQALVNTTDLRFGFAVVVFYYQRR